MDMIKIIEDKSPEPNVHGGIQTNIKYKNFNLGFKVHSLLVIIS